MKKTKDSKSLLDELLNNMVKKPQLTIIQDLVRIRENAILDTQARQEVLGELQAFGPDRIEDIYEDNEGNECFLIRKDFLINWLCETKKNSRVFAEDMQTMVPGLPFIPSMN